MKAAVGIALAAGSRSGQARVQMFPRGGPVLRFGGFEKETSFFSIWPLPQVLVSRLGVVWLARKEERYGQKMARRGNLVNLRHFARWRRVRVALTSAPPPPNPA